MSKNLEQDFIDLFSFAKKGHMGKYIYMYRPDIYDKAICQDVYYPFMMERDLLIKERNKICNIIQEVTQVIEFGPGSATPMKYKTIPFLKALEQSSSLGQYIALDSNFGYAQAACDLIKLEFKAIKTEAIEFDFSSKQGFEKVQFNQRENNRNLIFSFGQSIFANSINEETPIVLHNIARFLNQGDYFLFGADTNRDEHMLQAAYDSQIVHELLLNTMYHLKYELNPEGFEPERFSTLFKWNQSESTVEHYLKPTLPQRLNIGKHEFFIKEDQEFNILNSRKLDIGSIERLLNTEKIEIKEIISLEKCPKKIFSLIIAQKEMH